MSKASSPVSLDITSLFTTYPYSIFSWATVAGLSLYFIRRYVRGGVCTSKARLDGKTAIITGANTGIGLETAVDFAQRNARVILACRSKEKGEATVKQVKKRSGNDNVVFMSLDLSSLDSVRSFCASVLDREPRIDILVNNAGVVWSVYAKTVDGFELHLGVNHLGHFLLTNLLLDRLKEAPAARIVNVSSSAHHRGRINFDDLNSTQSYPGRIEAYGQSKLANVVFTRSLAKHLEGTSVTANAVHPGLVKTEAGRHLNLVLQILGIPLQHLFFKTSWQGAQTTIYCAVSEEMEGVSGQYLADCKIKKLTNPQATDDSVGEKLWEASTQMVGLHS